MPGLQMTGPGENLDEPPRALTLRSFRKMPGIETPRQSLALGGLLSSVSVDVSCCPASPHNPRARGLGRQTATLPPHHPKSFFQVGGIWAHACLYIHICVCMAQPLPLELPHGVGGWGA